MSSISFLPTPYGTVHVTASGEDTARVRRSIASQVGRRGLGKRLTIREHRGTVFAIYRKA